MSLSQKFKIAVSAMLLMPVAACAEKPAQQDKTAKVTEPTEQDKIGACIDAILADKKQPDTLIRGAVVKTVAGYDCMAGRMPDGDGLVISVNDSKVWRTQIIGKFYDNGDRDITTTIGVRDGRAAYVQKADEASFINIGIDDKYDRLAGKPQDALDLMQKATQGPARPEAIFTRSFYQAALARLAKLNA